MQRCDVPALATPPTTGGLADALVEHAAAEPDRPLVAVRSGSTWRDVAAVELLTQVTTLAKGLLAYGVEPGDRVAVMARTRYEWTLVDYACWSIDACPVPVYPTASAEQVAWILADSAAVGCVVEKTEQADLVRSVHSDLPDLREVWTIDDGAVADLTEAGKDRSDAEVAERRRAVTADHPATIVYTSGTTGRQKGCVLTHGNFLAEVDNAIELLYPVFRAHSRHPASTVLFLPLAHVLGRMIQVGCLRAGVRLGHEPSMQHDDLRHALCTFRPTFVVGVPHLFEKIYRTARDTATQRGRGASFDRAATIASRWARALERQHHGDGATPRIGQRIAHACYDLLVYRRIRAQLGGRLRYAISGGSALDPELARFFAGAGLLIYEGYGLTETTAAATINPPLLPRFGTAGRPLPGTSVRVADDGEIQVAGGQVFPAYWADQEATAAALDDGWMSTGDLGRLDDDGYLVVTGRKKDVIVTGGGKNVVPGPLEDALRRHPLVSQCMVVGDGRPFVAALITLDGEAAAAWAREHVAADPPEHTADLAARPAVVEEIQAAVDAANTTVSRAESIRAFRLLAEDFTEENGLLTPSLKVKKQAVAEQYASTVDDIYAKSRTG